MKAKESHGVVDANPRVPIECGGGLEFDCFFWGGFFLSSNTFFFSRHVSYSNSNITRVFKVR